MTDMERKQRIKVDELDEQAVAFLYGQGNQQDAIATIMNMSQATVSRCVQHAIKKGWLDYKPRFIPESLPSERIQLIEARASPRKHLMDQLQKLAAKNKISYGPREIRVFPSATMATDEAAWKLRFTRFGKDAAEYMRGKLQHATICGISWGRTISTIERGIRQLGPSPSRAAMSHSIVFIPLCGVPLGKTAMQLSASSLAAQFHEIMNDDTDSDYILHLAALPALIPREIPRNVRKTVITALKGCSPTYDQIFSPRNEDEEQTKGYINKMDTMITGVGGVGSVDDPQGYWRDSVLKAGGADAELLDKVASGDIGGILFPRTDRVFEDDEKEQLRDLRRRWTGIKKWHMKKCARRAVISGTTGVILVAIGAHKASSVLESVKRGLVNELVIDRALADELTAKLAKELGTS